MLNVGIKIVPQMWDYLQAGLEALEVAAKTKNN